MNKEQYDNIDIRHTSNVLPRLEPNHLTFVILPYFLYYGTFQSQPIGIYGNQAVAPTIRTFMFLD